MTTRRNITRNIYARWGRPGRRRREGMIPAYPSLTFANHYTLATGLYPEHHGIVANNFYDPQRKRAYHMTDAAAVTDGSWYGGTPIWVLAEQQGMRAACFFWPGSEAEIQGTRPSYYLKYDEKIPDDLRVSAGVGVAAFAGGAAAAFDYAVFFGSGSCGS